MNQELFDFSSMSKGIDLTSYTDRQKIEILEWLMAGTGNDIAAELPMRHYVHGGMYYRELDIPAGVVLTGKVHLLEHVFILLKGELSIMADEGMKRITAPASFRVKAGTKKIGYAHSDVTCTTIHATKKKNLDKIEKEYFKDSDLAWVGELMSTIGVLL